MPVNISRVIGQLRGRPDFNFLADDLQKLADAINKQETALSALSKTVASPSSAATPPAPAKPAIPVVVAPSIPAAVVIPAKPASNAIGIPGLDGLDGEDGLGIPGPPGPAGGSGTTGPQGPAGLGLDGLDADEPMMIPGAPGPTGNPGATGPAGPMGLGIDGLDGEDGMAIPGPQGPAGSGGGGGSGLWNQILSATPTQTITGLSNFLGTGAASTNGAVGQVISGNSPGFGAYTTTVPATPYTITALMTVNGASAAVTGLGWTDTTKIQFIYVNNGNNHTPIVQHNSNISTFAGTDFSGNGGSMSYFLAWLRIKDDGTNVTFSYSNDGITFTQAFTITKASGYLGSTGYSHIFCGAPGNAAAGSVTILSWTQS